MTKAPNAAQAQAIAHLAGPMMVLAGPGSGKTTVIVERTAHMILEGKIPAHAILVMTFSRLAAQEMQDRFRQRMGAEGAGVAFGTFHSIFFGILRQAYGYTAANILREGEKRDILKEILVKEGEDLGDADFLEDLIREISMVKTSRVAIEHYHSANCPDDVFQRIFRSYSQVCTSRRKLDFDDMLLSCHTLFERREDILAAWRGRFAYILVDEFQDIDPLQYSLLRMLAAPKDNLFIVGDDDQSIYRFRGARPELMLHFTKDYPEAKTVILDVNYRCSRNILKTALRVVGNNKARFSKNLTTPNSLGEAVKVEIYADPREETLHVAKELKAAADRGEDLRQSAVLFRTNQEAQPLLSACMELGVPFHMREKLPNLFQHWICRDLMAYMELAREGPRRSAFLSVMNRPNRYLSREAVSQATISGRGEKRGMFVDLDRLLVFYQDKDWMQDRVETLKTHLTILRPLAPFAAITFIRKGIGYEDYLAQYAAYRKMKEEDLLQILDQIQESARGLSSFEEWEASIQEYTQKLEDQARLQQKDPQGAALATLHGAKGLEYDRVFILNVNESMLPYRKAVLPEAVEEERRLFYVGMTRARKELHLCLVRRSGDHALDPSRFLLEAGYRPPARKAPGNHPPIAK